MEEIPSGFFKPHSTWIPWQKIIVDCQFNRIVGFLVVVWKEANFLRQARRRDNVWTPYMRVLAFITSALTTTTDCPIYTRSDISSNSKGVLARIWHISVRQSQYSHGCHCWICRSVLHNYLGHATVMPHHDMTFSKQILRFVKILKKDWWQHLFHR